MMTDEELIVYFSDKNNELFWRHRDDLTRLLALARQGVAVRWKPIAEIHVTERIICPRGFVWNWTTQSYHKRPKPFWETTRGTAWSRDNQPTKAISFSALEQTP